MDCCIRTRHIPSWTKSILSPEQKGHGFGASAVGLLNKCVQITIFCTGRLPSAVPQSVPQCRTISFTVSLDLSGLTGLVHTHYCSSMDISRQTLPLKKAPKKCEEAYPGSDSGSTVTVLAHDYACELSRENASSQGRAQCIQPSIHPQTYRFAISQE